MEFLHWLFDASSFVTRDRCGDWGPWLPWLAQFDNAIFALSYFLISVALYWLYHKRRDVLPAPWMLLGFCIFILFCGLSHVTHVLAFHWPAYRVFVLLVNFPGAIVSAAVACSLPYVVRQLATIPMPAELQASLERERVAADEATVIRLALEAQNSQLIQLVAQMEAELTHMQYHKDIHSEVGALRTHLAKIRKVVV